ncbi:unnamed protein product [Heligmosomoides polygyrus]|uniref:Secreted protein n=1 Tax=Heligmosomoides polygyrus TaxID=6339 RepID=A0A183FQR4_HELPZ|nr:unnamed protein product [Heligmosomoides polygyrus]
MIAGDVDVVVVVVLVFVRRRMVSSATPPSSVPVMPPRSCRGFLPAIGRRYSSVEADGDLSALGYTRFARVFSVPRCFFSGFLAAFRSSSFVLSSFPPSAWSRDAAIQSVAHFSWPPPLPVWSAPLNDPHTCAILGLSRRQTQGHPVLADAVYLSSHG